ncbi:MAG: hypothetical protein FJ286_01085 [Planctomycetes bacterium]|nr:hypothetical protein [Planctomycetota bacterium]
MFEDFVRAGIYDLNRIAKGTEGDFGDGPHLPAIPRAAQLSLLLLLVTKGVERRHEAVYPQKAELEGHLGKVYKKSKACWDEALAAKTSKARDAKLRDTGGIEPHVNALVKFADKKFGLKSVPLSAFGVTDVQLALGMLIKKLATESQQAIGLSTAQKKQKSTGESASPSHDAHAVPNPVLGGILIATVGADIAMQGSATPDQVKALRVGAGIGTTKKTPGTPEKPPVKAIRRTLEGLAEHVWAPAS